MDVNIKLHQYPSKQLLSLIALRFILRHLAAQNISQPKPSGHHGADGGCLHDKQNLIKKETNVSVVFENGNIHQKRRHKTSDISQPKPSAQPGAALCHARYKKETNVSVVFDNVNIHQKRQHDR